MPLVRKVEDLDIEHILQHSTNKFFEDYTPNKMASRKYESIKISTDRSTIKLIDKSQKDLLSIVYGNFKTYNGIEYFEIEGTYSKLERQGFLTYLFEILVYEFGYKILSDSEQSSPGSKEFWQAHIRRNKFSIYRLDLETNFKRNAKRFNENEIWDEEGTNDEFTSFLNNFDDFVEDEESDDFENLDNDLEEIDEELINEFKTENKSIEKIRLVAQKYVG